MHQQLTTSGYTKGLINDFTQPRTYQPKAGFYCLQLTFLLVVGAYSFAFRIVEQGNINHAQNVSLGILSFRPDINSRQFITKLQKFIKGDDHVRKVPKKLPFRRFEMTSN